MKLRREIPFPGTEAELEAFLREYALLFRARIRRRGNLLRLTCGETVSTNPNTIPWIAEATLDAGTVRIQAWPSGLPLAPRRARRIVEARLDQLVDYLETKLRGGAVEKFSESSARNPFVAVGPGIPGACVALSSWAAQTTVAMVFTLFAALFPGMTVIGRQLLTLETRAATVEKSGEIPLPSKSELNLAGASFPVQAAALLMLPIAFFVAFALSLAHLAGDLWVRANRFTFWVYAFFAIYLTVSFWSSTGPIIAVLFALLMPIAAYDGTLLVWAWRRERRREPGRPDPAAHRRRRVVMVGGILAGLSLLAAVVPRPGGDFVDRLVTFRDRYLLSNAPGRHLAEFYYRHTLYAAEAFKPVFVDPESDRPRDRAAVRTVLLWTKDASLPATLRSFGLVVETAKTPGRIEQRSHDLYVFEDDPKVRNELRDVEDSTLLLQTTPAPAEGFETEPLPCPPGKLAKTLERVSDRSFRGSGLSALSYSGWLAVFLAAPLYLLLVALGTVALPVAVLYRKLPAGWAHAIVGIVFLGSVGGILAAVDAHEEEIRKVGEIRSLEGTKPALLAERLGDQSPDVRYEAAVRIWGLLRGTGHRDAALFQTLLTALGDADVRVRLWACGCLGRFGDKRAVTPLMRALEDPELFVRYRAAEALGTLRAAEAVPALQDRMKNDLWYIGSYALGALREIDPGTH